MLDERLVGRAMQLAGLIINEVIKYEIWNVIIGYQSTKLG